MGRLNVEEFNKIRASARLVSEVLEEVVSCARPGITTRELDEVAETAIADRGCVPAFKGYRGYPTVTCISLNEVVVHGIPSERKLCDTDLVSIDVGLSKDGYFGDVAVTITMGDVSTDVGRLIDVTRHALEKGVAKAVPGARLGDVSHAVQKCVERSGFSVIRSFVGHGIGTQLHDSPEIPNYGKPRRGVVLEEGMVLAIEPMTAMGRYEVSVADDGWTAATRDRSISAHFEHMVLVKDDGPEILTYHPSGSLIAIG